MLSNMKLVQSQFCLHVTSALHDSLCREVKRRNARLTYVVNSTVVTVPIKDDTVAEN